MILAKSKLKEFWGCGGDSSMILSFCLWQAHHSPQAGDLQQHVDGWQLGSQRVFPSQHLQREATPHL